MHGIVSINDNNLKKAMGITILTSDDLHNHGDEGGAVTQEHGDAQRSDHRMAPRGHVEVVQQRRIHQQIRRKLDRGL